MVTNTVRNVESGDERKPAVAIPSGARYVAGSGRTLVMLAGGTVVARAAAENLYARSQGYRSNYSRRQAYQASKAESTYQEGLETATANGYSAREYNEMRARVSEDRAVNGRDMDRTPGGPLAQYLTMIGRRTENDTWNVGESPSLAS